MLPCHCPACSAQLNVKALRCENCQTEVSGLYDLPVLARLTEDEQRFVLQFVQSSGSLKEMARLMGMSYPTVRNLLDDLIERLHRLETNNQH